MAHASFLVSETVGEPEEAVLPKSQILIVREQLDWWRRQVIGAGAGGSAPGRVKTFSRKAQHLKDPGMILNVLFPLSDGGFHVLLILSENLFVLPSS